MSQEQAFFSGRGFAVLDSHAGRRTMTVRGTAEQVSDVFGVALKYFERPVRPSRSGRSPRAGTPEAQRTQRYRGFDGAVRLPPEITDVVTAVVGLDNRSGGAPGAAPTGDPPSSNSLPVPQIAS